VVWPISDVSALRGRSEKARRPPGTAPHAGPISAHGGTCGTAIANPSTRQPAGGSGRNLRIRSQTSRPIRHGANAGLAGPGAGQEVENEPVYSVVVFSLNCGCFFFFFLLYGGLGHWGFGSPYPLKADLHWGWTGGPGAGGWSAYEGSGRFTTVPAKGSGHRSGVLPDGRETKPRDASCGHMGAVSNYLQGDDGLRGKSSQVAPDGCGSNQLNSPAETTAEGWEIWPTSIGRGFLKDLRGDAQKHQLTCPCFIMRGLIFDYRGFQFEKADPPLDFVKRKGPSDGLAWYYFGKKSWLDWDEGRQAKPVLRSATIRVLNQYIQPPGPSTSWLAEVLIPRDPARGQGKNSVDAHERRKADF